MSYEHIDPIITASNSYDQDEQFIPQTDSWEDISPRSSGSNDHSSTEMDDDEEELDKTSSTSSKSDSLWNDILDAWPQHCLAILIACIATYAAYKLQVPKAEKLSPNQLAVQHYHLESYFRTANITFCEPKKQQLDGLELFDFNVPKKLLPAMYTHYAADIYQDNVYTNVLKSFGNFDMDELTSASPEVRCIVEQAAQTKKSYIVGHSYFSVKPTVSSMYPSHSNQVAVLSSKKELQPVHLTFTGFGAKFVNLSPQPVMLYWDGRNTKERRLVGEIAPYSSLGTATTPGQPFSVTPVYDSAHALERWVVTADDAVLYYEPEETYRNPTQKMLYEMQKLHQDFAKHYMIHAKRTYLANFPRAFPLYHMWPAQYMEQKHLVRDDVSDKEYTLKVVSATPRVFVISNFMSKLECRQLIELVQRQSGRSDGFSKSTVYSGSLAQPQRDLSTRSSSNAWLARQTTNLTDQLYRRAAKVLNIDEALMQAPDSDHEDAEYVHSIAESLQVVRYHENEEYTAHHDFVYPPPLKRHQPTRFATLLLYLNDGFEGGETVFPRAVNTQHHEGVTITPKQGQAVLFYNVLSDGNVDDLSQHSSMPVKEGTKYLANLWVWEPHIH